MVNDIPVLKIVGNISTSADGIGKLMQFYQEASTYKDTRISVNLYHMTWIDANLTAFLNAITYRLQNENNITLSTDFDYLADKFNVLFKNGWLEHPDYKIADIHGTTIPCTTFQPTEDLEFISYVEGNLMCHKGLLPALDNNTRKKIQSDLLEIFTNVPKHARTDDPLFVCGQFYPTKKYFVFTMVDLGVGFLHPIQEFTSGEVNTHIGAIRWALSGQSSSVTDPSTQIGGFGLQGIYEYSLKNQGIFHIYSGTDYWGTDLENTSYRGHQTLSYFKGSVINLFFNVNT